MNSKLPEPKIDKKLLRRLLERKMAEADTVFIPNIISFPDRHWVNGDMQRVAKVEMDIVCKEFKILVNRAYGVEGLIIQFFLERSVYKLNKEKTDFDRSAFERDYWGDDFVINVIFSPKKSMNELEGVQLIAIQKNKNYEYRMLSLSGNLPSRVLRNFEEIIQHGNEFIR